jgi:ParB family chromosome partitioning protein
MKRDLLFIAEQMMPLLDEKLQEMAARNRGIKAKDTEPAGRLLTAFVRKADEGTIGKLIIETVILLTARTQADVGKTLRAAALVYGVDTDAVALKSSRSSPQRKGQRRPPNQSRSQRQRQSEPPNESANPSGLPPGRPVSLFGGQQRTVFIWRLHGHTLRRETNIES